ncbi:P13 family porin [Treponema sp.]|uniref:P13 family porin n=1 Tax=Treponema sp. TaxID=166 RepID=UPI003FD84B42
MKRIFILLFIFFSLLQQGFSENISKTEDIKFYQKKNAIIGFGKGSRLQGDSESAKLLLATDITGITLMVSGGISTAVAVLYYDIIKASMGECTTADIWICGGITFVGTAIFTTGRIIGWKLPVKFERKKDMEISANFSTDVKSVTAGITIKF